MDKTSRWTHYAVLGIDEAASQQQIRAAYVRLIKQCHPDVNEDKVLATEMTKKLNEAYVVLKDPIRRLEYDNLLQMKRRETEQVQSKDNSERSDKHKWTNSVDDDSGASSQAESPGARSGRATQPLPHYCCEICQRQDETIRVTLFLWVVSVFLMTYKRGWGRVLCSRCRLKYSLLFNLEVLLLGWWGFPWGPIFSLEALARNLCGGIQPSENNAALLGAVAYELYSKGDYSKAHSCAMISYKYSGDVRMKEFLDFLSPFATLQNSRSVTDRLLRLHPAWYNIALMGMVLVSLIWLLQPGTSGLLKQTAHICPAKQNSLADTPVDACDRAVDELSRYLYDTLPMVRTTRRGHTVIRHYILDRSKLDAASVCGYATAVRKAADAVCDDASMPAELLERASRAYFNAQILLLSLEYFDSIDSDIKRNEVISEINELSDLESLTHWLSKPTPQKRYATLVDVLDAYERIVVAKSELQSLAAAIDANRATLTQMQRQLEAYETQGAYDLYNSLVSKYNDKIRQGKSMIAEHNLLVEEFNTSLSNANLDSVRAAFNNCLDSEVLFQKFDEVDLDLDIEDNDNSVRLPTP